MAGSIFGLGMSQRVDSNALPSVGWLLYIYAANSSTPSQIWQDTALTIPAAWPLAADANGMMPPFWLADGSYRVRGTNANGSIIYFDIASVLALGPSSGPAPSGGVDPTTIFQTGDVIWVDFQGVRAGWVRDNGRTIGSASSGATERANADCQSLFTYLWNNFSNTICPVGGGRGASASADWAAPKQIATPDKRGYIPGGLDDMGNSAAGRWSGVPIINGTVTTAGTTLGETLHTTLAAEMPAHSHGTSVTDPGHTHPLNGAPPSGAGPNVTLGATSSTSTSSTGSAMTGITVSISNTGGGGAHNNTQRTVLGTFYRKL